MERSQAAALDGTGGPAGCLLRHLYAVSQGKETVACILPFTSGGFLYIALVNVLPDLLEEDDPWHSLQQVLLLCMGIVVMVLFSLFVE